MRRIAFINEKGGTCKTTLCVNLGAYWAGRGKRVLIVDVDSQGHAGKSLGLDVRNLPHTTFDLLTGRAPFEAVVQRTGVERLEIVPSNKSMSEFPLEASRGRDPHRRLATALEKAAAYDLVLFDSPPSLSLTTTNVMVATDEVVIPVSLTYFSLDGCAEIVDTLKRVAAEQDKPGLEAAWVVPTLYRKTALADEILAKLKTYFPGKVAKTPLGYNVKIDEAQSHGQTIWQYAPSSKGAEMLQKIADELVSKPANARG